MLLSVSAAVESIAVNSGLQSIKKKEKIARVNKMWQREKDQRLRERIGAKIPSGLTISCRLHVGFR